MNFRFDEKKHAYFLDDKPLHGVTSVLGVIAKPALIQWAADEACKYIRQNTPLLVSTNAGVLNINTGEFTPEPDSIYWNPVENILKEARLAHRKKKEKAGEAGTSTHEIAEAWVKDCIARAGGKPITGFTHEIAAFANWAMDNNVTFLASERRVYDASLWIAGTFDLLLVKDGKKLVADIKTSKAIYPTYFYQMAAYRLMLEAMGEKDIEGSVVLRLGKDGSFEEQYRYDYETDKAAFLGALAIHKANLTYA